MSDKYTQSSPRRKEGTSDEVPTLPWADELNIVEDGLLHAKVTKPAPPASTGNKRRAEEPLSDTYKPHDLGWRYESDSDDEKYEKSEPLANKVDRSQGLKRRGESLGEDFRPREPPSCYPNPSTTPSHQARNASPLTFNFQSPPPPTSAPSSYSSQAASSPATIPNTDRDRPQSQDSHLPNVDEAQSDNGWPAGADDLLEAAFDVAMHELEEEQLQIAEEEKPQATQNTLSQQLPAPIDEDMSGGPNEEKLFEQLDLALGRNSPQLTGTSEVAATTPASALPRYIRRPPPRDDPFNRKPTSRSPPIRGSPSPRASLYPSSPLRQSTISDNPIILASCMACEATKRQLEETCRLFEEVEENGSELRSQVSLLEGQVGAFEAQIREQEVVKAELRGQLGAVQDLALELEQSREEVANLSQGYDLILEASKNELRNQLQEQTKLAEELRIENGRKAQGANAQQQQLEQTKLYNLKIATELREVEAAYKRALAEKDAEKKEAEVASARTLAEKDRVKREAEATYLRSLAEKDAAIDKLQLQLASNTPLPSTNSHSQSGLRILEANLAEEKAQKEAIVAHSEATHRELRDKVSSLQVELSQEKAKTTARSLPSFGPELQKRKSTFSRGLLAPRRGAGIRKRTGHSLLFNTYMEGKAQQEDARAQNVPVQEQKTQPVLSRFAKEALVTRAEFLDRENAELVEEIADLHNTFNTRLRDTEKSLGKEKEEALQALESKQAESLDLYLKHIATVEARFAAIQEDKERAVKQLAALRDDLEQKHVTIEEQSTELEKLQEQLRSKQLIIGWDNEECTRLTQELEETRVKAEASLQTLTDDVIRARRGERVYIRSNRQHTLPALEPLSPSVEETVNAEVEARMPKLRRELEAEFASRQEILIQTIRDDTPPPPTFKEHGLIKKAKEEVEKTRAEIDSLREELKQVKEATGNNAGGNQYQTPAKKGNRRRRRKNKHATPEQPKGSKGPGELEKMKLPEGPEERPVTIWKQPNCFCLLGLFALIALGAMAALFGLGATRARVDRLEVAGIDTLPEMGVSPLQEQLGSYETYIRRVDEFSRPSTLAEPKVLIYEDYVVDKDWQIMDMDEEVEELTTPPSSIIQGILQPVGSNQAQKLPWYSCNVARMFDAWGRRAVGC